MVVNEHNIGQAQRIDQAVDWLRARLPRTPQVALILGSGLGDVGAQLRDRQSFLYTDIPFYPRPTVWGHAGEWMYGYWHELPVVLLRGRVHLYEGYAPEDVSFPIRVLRRLGVDTLIQTNAAGAIDPSLQVGQLMLVTDHINAMGRNPLVGPNDETIGPRFPDLSQAYSPRLRILAQHAADAIGLELVQGVYVGVLGPSFETPAEIRMFRAWGAQAVGMSTVPETIAAVHAGMDVLALSCMSNMAAGILDQPLTHEEVMEAGERVRPALTALLDAIVQRLAVDGGALR